MKKIKNVFLLLLMGAGLCLMLAGSAMGAKRSMRLNLLEPFNIHMDARSSLFLSDNTEYVTLDRNDLPAFTGVSVNLIDEEITLSPADYYGISMRYQEDYEIQWEIKDGTLMVSKMSNASQISMMDWSFGGSDSEVTIYCPADALTYINLQTVSGEIEANGFTAEVVAFETVSGDIDAEEIEALKLSAETVSGNIDLSQCKNEDVIFSTVSGEIAYDSIQALNKYTLSLSTVSGDYHINGERVSKSEYNHYATPSAPYTLSAESVSGDMDFTFR